MYEIAEQGKLESIIYEIRGKQVMLDSDLARLYECANGTKTIKQAVKRHMNKFPDRYMFQLTTEEYDILKSQIGTSSLNNYNSVRKLPVVFTEQGVAMLATILRTPVAAEITIKIIDAFVCMRKCILSENKNNLLVNHEERILKLEKLLNEISTKKNSIIYEDRMYDAYSLLIDILSEAKSEIIIIDNYINKEVFDILRNIDKSIIVITKSFDDILVQRYIQQYSNVTIKNNNLFHDRYIILDRKTIYISGSSLKDIGKKYSYIYKINEEMFIEELIKRVENIV